MADISNLTKSSYSSNTVNDPMTFFLFPALVICLIGIPGTLKTIHFYRRQSKTSAGATPILLMVLAVYDTLALVTILVCNIALIIFLFHRMYNPMNTVLLTSSQARELKMTKLGLVLTCIFVVCVSPLGIFYPLRGLGSSPIPQPVYRAIMPVATLLESINYSVNSLVYYIGSARFRADFQQIICFLVCNIALIIFLFHRMYNPMNTVPLTSSQARELKMTKLVLVFTCIFVVCVSPLGIFYPLRGLGNSPIPQPVYRAIMPMATLLESINYSVNSLVYYIGSARFRADVKQIICCKKSRLLTIKCICSPQYVDDGCLGDIPYKCALIDYHRYTVGEIVTSLSTANRNNTKQEK
ncbi:uncharacterized protein LOC110454490, partial [Mizuhopecten yessoensis]|uniref:uncharacterized protein LOC110454490 n=1 Tax=Mizuhopecten yessoensis TaxID=6573 RepID=UPI000B45D2DF